MTKPRYPLTGLRNQKAGQLAAEVGVMNTAREMYRNDPLLWHLNGTNARTITTAQRDRMIALLTVVGYEVTKK